MLIKPGLFGYAYTDAKREIFDERNKLILEKQQSIDIILFGDSITEAINAEDVSKVLTVINSGIAGDVTYYMQQRFAADVIQLHPRKVVILCGINDLHVWQDGGIYKQLSEQEVEQQIIEHIFGMIELASDANVEVLIGSILPVLRPSERRIDNILINRMVVSINQRLKKYALEKNLYFIDYYQEFVKNEAMNMSFSEDGLHLNEKGIEKMIALLQISLKIYE